MARPSRTGCGGAGGEAAQVRVTAAVSVGAGGSLVLPWDSFQTTSQDVFGTLPGPDTAGDTSLAVNRDGLVVVASAVEWEPGAYSHRAYLYMGQFNYIDLLHGIWPGVEGPATSALDGSFVWNLDYRTGAVAAGYNCPVLAQNFDAGPRNVTYAQLNILWWPMSAAPASVY